LQGVIASAAVYGLQDYTVRSWWHFGGRPARFPEPFPPWFSDSGSETA